MVDEFTVDIERMKESSCFHPENGVVVDERISSGTVSIPTQEVLGCFSKREEEESSKECRICQEECEESAMEAPCACNGTLKFAHRKCIQKWCNLKGNITCEICKQIFTPNYSAAPRRSINSDDLAIDIRQSWVAAQHDRRFLAFTPDEFHDYSIEHNNNIAFCHSLILFLMLLLLIKHFVVVARDSTVTEDNMKVFFNVSIMQLGSIVLPCYVIIRSCYFHLRQYRIQRHVRHRQIWG